MESSDSRRIQPWRCLICNERFVFEKSPVTGHLTIYEPRGWEMERQYR